jgi:hypothetical protein
MRVESPRYSNQLHDAFFNAAAAAGLPANPDFNEWDRPQVGACTAACTAVLRSTAATCFVHDISAASLYILHPPPTHTHTPGLYMHCCWLPCTNRLAMESSRSARQMADGRTLLQRTSSPRWGVPTCASSLTHAQLGSRPRPQRAGAHELLVLSTQWVAVAALQQQVCDFACAACAVLLACLERCFACCA